MHGYRPPGDNRWFRTWLHSRIPAHLSYSCGRWRRPPAFPRAAFPAGENQTRTTPTRENTAFESPCSVRSVRAVRVF